MGKGRRCEAGHKLQSPAYRAFTREAVVNDGLDVGCVEEVKLRDSRYDLEVIEKKRRRMKR